MTLTELHYATILASTQHFGLAAKQCNVSQPTLSIAIKKFEAELGVEIFERTATNVLLTHMGEKLLLNAIKYLMNSQLLKILQLMKERGCAPPFVLVLSSP